MKLLLLLIPKIGDGLKDKKSRWIINYYKCSFGHQFQRRNYCSLTRAVKSARCGGPLRRRAVSEAVVLGSSNVHAQARTSAPSVDR